MTTTATTKEAKPGDARLIHLMLNALGVEQYEEGVSLQLMTFAHQYATSILQDAQVYQDHRLSGAGGASAKDALEVGDIKLAITSKTNHSFRGAPPKEFLLELAGDRNRRPLPPVNPGYGLRLPPEKYCLTNVNWAQLTGSEADVQGVNGTAAHDATAAARTDPDAMQM